jgi:hypothetical protein
MWGDRVHVYVVVLHIGSAGCCVVSGCVTVPKVMTLICDWLAIFATWGATQMLVFVALSKFSRMTTDLAWHAMLHNHVIGCSLTPSSSFVCGCCSSKVPLVPLYRLSQSIVMNG